ncbi:MAG: thioredoxin family protein [Sarcina sp.]
MSKIYKFITIGVLSVSIFNIVGCNDSQAKNNQDVNTKNEEMQIDNIKSVEETYERDNSQGQIVEIKLDEAINLVNDKETAIIMFSVTTCKDCKILDAILEDYLKNHNITIKKVILDKEGTSKDEIQANRNKINTVFPNFNSTPSTYYIKNGETIDEILYVKTHEELDEWVIKNKLDKK